MNIEERNDCIEEAIEVLSELKKSPNPCYFVLLASTEKKGDTVMSSKYWGSGTEQVGLAEAFSFAIKTRLHRLF